MTGGRREKLWGRSDVWTLGGVSANLKEKRYWRWWGVNWKRKRKWGFCKMVSANPWVGFPEMGFLEIGKGTGNRCNGCGGGQMAKRLIPCLNRVLVEKIIPPSKTNAGILLPEKTTKLNSGKVVAVGPGIHDRDGKLIPAGVKEGDTVLLPEYGGSEVKLGDKE
ncbi:hypothetical protein RHMOL_Rhmol04G0161100 [Rhododendron molle]|uniref:Uncharacterized protein n=1 Tax=Rhododendron molle TaxID=49168 RepID=A0ACC0P2M4_RHOML|nr:hypothetical protein RHMOL_Rhmol04G0161100 [Rhododendron molle]